MRTFSVKFKTISLDLDFIVTESEKNHRFKVEMVTGEPDPIVLRRSDNGEWVVEQHGGRTISTQGYQDIGKGIDEYLGNQIS